MNPTWGEAFTIDFECILPRGGRLSPLKIIVLDYDKGSAISSADVDTLGKVTVPWTDAFATEPRRVSLSLKYKGQRLARLMSPLRRLLQMTTERRLQRSQLRRRPTTPRHASASQAASSRPSCASENWRRS